MDNEAGVDFLEPWTVKSMPRRTRLAILAAARKEELTAAQWLQRRVAEWISDGSPTVVGHGMTGQADLAELRQLVEMASILAPEGKETALLREARARVRERLKRLRLPGADFQGSPELLQAEAPESELASGGEGEGE